MSFYKKKTLPTGKGNDSLRKQGSETTSFYVFLPPRKTGQFL
jgi:hypothetical protein